MKQLVSLRTKTVSLVTIVCISTPLMSMQNAPAYAVILDTDLQYGNKTQEERKAFHADCIKHLIKNTPSLQKTAVIVAGDMIEGQLPIGEFSACLPCMNWPLFHDVAAESKKQLKAFKKNFLEILEKTPSTVVLDSPGNHEFYDPSQESLKFTKERHGNLRYTHHMGPLLIIMGAIYYDEKQREWLKEQLTNVPEEKPTIVVQHYNIVGDHDAWYPRKDDAPLTKILQGRNVIFENAHNHSSYKASVGGHECYCGGGKEFIVLGFDAHGKKISETGYVAEKQADGSYKPVAVPIPAWTPENNESDTLGEQIQEVYNGVVVNQHMFD